MQGSKTKYPSFNFQIIECSSEDLECPARELKLQSVSCKGWQTARYCSYPQHIVLQMHQAVKLRQITVVSHQHKIAKRVEIEYSMGRDQPFARLGHFSLSSNQDSNFSVRELRNIPVNVPCKVVKLYVHKNHINNFNIFNQVGLICVALYGEKLQKSSMPMEPQGNQLAKSQTMYDVNTLKKLKELEDNKRKAVENEDYELAKHLKLKIDQLKKLGPQLQDLERRKRIAVEREDFESANLIKEQIRRLTSGGGESREYEPPAKKNQGPPAYNPYKQKAQVSEVREDYSSISPVTKVEPKKPNPIPPKQVQKGPPVKHDDLPIHGAKQAQLPPQYPEQQQGKQTSQPQQLKGQQQKIANSNSEFYGEDIFRKIFSKNYANREQGLQQVKQIVSGGMHPDRPGMVSATLAIIKATIDDKITNVLMSSIELLDVLLKKYKPPKQDNSGSMQFILAKLSDYQGHSNQKVKLRAAELFSELPQYGMTNKNVCIRSLVSVDSKKAPAPKILIGRLETLSELIQQYKAGPNAEECAIFATKYVDDKNGDVRNSATNLLRCLIEEIGYQRIQPHLKNVRPQILKSIESMAQQQMATNNQKIPIQNMKGQQKYMQEEPIHQVKKQSKQPAAKQKQVVDSRNNPEYKCEFCGKYDPQFINQNFNDMHLFSSCPMLIECECQQVIEVSNLTSHLLSECKNSKYYKRCARCKQAIHQRNYRNHTNAGECQPGKPLAKANRCPLCHQDIDPGVEGWKQHLVVKGCANHNRGN